MLKFTCPRCGKRLNAPSGVAGRPGRCPYCREPLVIPDTALDTAASTVIELNTAPLSRLESHPGADWRPGRPHEPDKWTLECTFNLGMTALCGMPSARRGHAAPGPPVNATLTNH